MNSRFAQSLAFVVLVAIVTTYPLLLFGVDRALESMQNSPVRWIPESFAGVQEFRDFVKRFEAHEVVLISWDGATVDDVRLSQLSDELRRRQSQRDGPRYYSDVVDGHNLLREMMVEPLELSRAAALRRLQGFLVGPDRMSSCAIVVLTDYGAKEREAALEVIVSAAREKLALDIDDLRLAGPPVDASAIDRLSRRSLQLFAVPSAVGSFLLCWLCLRSLWFTIPVLLVAAYGQAFCLALVYFTGGQMNAVLIVLPALVFVLSVSAGIHLTNYFMEEIRQGESTHAVRRAIQRALPPSALAAVTTAIGLASLLVSDVDPVRQFGLLGASGVLLCFALLFLVLPGAMFRWQSKFGKTVPDSDLPDPQPEPPTPFWGRVAGFIASKHVLITIAGVLLLVGTGWGLQRLRTTVDVISLLDQRVPEVRDTIWFQEKIGPLIPVEVIVRFPLESDLDLIERVGLTSEVHRELNRIESLGGAISVATFLPPIPRSGGIGATARRSIFRNRIEAEKESLVQSGYLREDTDGQHWRIGSRAAGRADIDYADLLEVIRARIEPVVERFEAKNNVELVTTYTGVTSAVYEVQRALLADLFNSFLTAVVLVGLVMMVAFRGVITAFVAMIPNLFPTFLMFGTLGWLDRAIDIGTVMTASVALGIAVDGTFHFLSAFRTELAIGHSPLCGVARSYQHCGKAVLQTTLVCAVGIFVYSLSSFLPARHFAVSFVLLLMLAAIGDLILLPALLSGRASSLFIRPLRANERAIH